jgi:3-methyl-2-oxobutanoate hydroxymethyltransferase
MSSDPAGDAPEPALRPTPLPARLSVPAFAARKGERPLVLVTAYDAAQARLADAAGVDAILVGDSLGMVTLGHETTLPVTLDDMVRHTRAVSRGVTDRRTPTGRAPSPENAARGARHALVIADLPFGTYGASVEDGVRNGARLLSEGNAQAVKLEGAGPVLLETVRCLAAIGVPVMGHLGMTPQFVHRFGGFRAQGTTDAAGEALLNEAAALVEAGVFGIVLEVIPAALARRVTQAVPVPTVGIGAGPHCDGQVQVLHDLIGLAPGPVRKHARRYVEAGRLIQNALAEYAADVRGRRFPSDENSL